MDDFSSYLASGANQADDRLADQTYLYRYYTADGGILYVGISNQPWQRHKAHMSRKWLFDAGHYCIEAFPAKRIALIAEWAIIEDKAPPHNFPVRFQERMWPVPFRWYRDITNGQFTGQNQAWFKLERGQIGRRQEKPSWAD